MDNVTREIFRLKRRIKTVTVAMALFGLAAFGSALALAEHFFGDPLFQILLCSSILCLAIAVGLGVYRGWLEYHRLERLVAIKFKEMMDGHPDPDFNYEDY